MKFIEYPTILADLRSFKPAAVDLAFGRGMFRDACQPQLVGSRRYDVPLDHILLNRWSGTAVQGQTSSRTPTRFRGPRIGAGPSPHRHGALPRKFVGNKAVPECRVVRVDVQGSIAQVCKSIQAPAP